MCSNLVEIQLLKTNKVVNYPKAGLKQIQISNSTHNFVIIVTIINRIQFVTYNLFKKHIQKWHFGPVHTIFTQLYHSSQFKQD